MANQVKPDVNTIWGSAGLATAISKAKQALGWVAEIPEYDQFNGMLQQISQFQQHVNQEGVALWDALTTYGVGSVVKSPVDRSLYRSLNADQLNVPPIVVAGGAVNANWVKLAHTDSEIQALVATYGVAAAQLQSQTFTAFSAGGTSTAVTLTPTPALTAYTAAQRFRIKFSVAAGANPTINISGLGPKNLKQYDSTGAKIAAVFAASQLSDAEYDGTDWVLLDQLPVNSKIGFQYSALYFLVSAITMNATYAGSLSVCNSASAFGVTLPALSTMTAGSTITIWNFGAGLVTVSPAESDILYAPPNTSPTFTIPQGACIVLGASPAATSWYLISGPQATETILGSARVATQTQVDSGTGDTAIITPQKLKWGFLASYGVNGYIKLPSWLFGLTIQWGTVAGSTTTQSFPLAFANSCAYLGATVQADANSGGTNTEYQTMAFVVSNSQFRLRNGTANGLTMKWLALGF